LDELELNWGGSGFRWVETVEEKDTEVTKIIDRNKRIERIVASTGVKRIWFNKDRKRRRFRKIINWVISWIGLESGLETEYEAESRIESRIESGRESRVESWTKLEWQAGRIKIIIRIWDWNESRIKGRVWTWVGKRNLK